MPILNACWKEPAGPPTDYQEVFLLPLAHRALRPAGLMQEKLGWLAFESQLCHVLAVILGRVMNLSGPQFSLHLELGDNNSMQVQWLLWS